jgi:hypothetical protein
LKTAQVDRSKYYFLNKPQKLNEVLWYTLLYAAFFGFFTHPTPFLPYTGLTDLFTARLALPVVRALTDRLIDGVRIPNFITNHFLLNQKRKIAV